MPQEINKPGEDGGLLEGLNPEQRAAVEHLGGPLLIVAGAGTGKTTVITRRIAHLIRSGQARADEILALTFTEKAAAEMEERADKLLPLGCFDLSVLTFHSFAERLLKESGINIGLPSRFKVINEFEQYALLRKNISRLNLDYYLPLGGNQGKHLPDLLKHFSRCKDEDISPEDYARFAEEYGADLDAHSSSVRSQSASAGEEDGLDRAARAGEALRLKEIAGIYAEYQKLLLEKDALDFGDLIVYALRLLRTRPAILQRYRRRWRYIMVDEFQDTNWAQYELVKMLAAPRNNLAVVGDDDQSVYRFRGASVANILQFKSDYPEAKTAALTANYRSRQEILDLAYGFIKLNDPNRLEYRLSAGRAEGEALSKRLVATRGPGAVIACEECPDLEEEAKRTAEKIAELKIADQEATWNDFAVLVRANDSAKPFCAALEEAGLPFQFLASRGLYAKAPVMDAISYLRLLDDYHESAALYRVLCLPLFGFGHQEVMDLNFSAKKKAESLFEALRSASAAPAGALRDKAQALLAMIGRHSRLAREKSASEVIQAFLYDSGYIKSLSGEETAFSRESISYLNQLLKRVQQFEEANDDRSVKAFLAELALEMVAGGSGNLAADADSGPETIRVMTVHSAKVLEFKYVFVVSLVDRRFPSDERSERIEIPPALLKESLPEGDHHLEEERRLFYVAMTRAADRLFLSWSRDTGGARARKPSRFLVECGLAGGSIAPAGAKPVMKQRRLFVPPPVAAARPSGLPLSAYFSYSQLAAYSNCPYQYFFSYVPKIPTRGKAAFSFGKTMHSTLQKMFASGEEKRQRAQGSLFAPAEPGADPAPTLAEAEAFYDESWVDDWYESPEEKRKYREKGRKLIKEFLELHRPSWPKTLWLEKQFWLKMNGGKTIKGAIDRIDEQPDGSLKIVDYKTGRPKEKLAFEEKEQLFIYQLAARQLFDRPVASLAFYYIENNSEIAFLGTEAELKKLEAKADETIARINAAEFPPKPSPLCAHCDFNGICEYRQL